ncbi:hypothetical protein MKX03_027641 [Papaver bracteatum]|nr:hypothetical protein MKX03_027641 [Papaver bracteatum]
MDRREKLQRKTLSDRLDDKSVEDILVNLPVKSLVRFKCVSKSWQSFIQDPSFVESHLSRSKKHPPQLLTAIYYGGVAVHKVTIPWAVNNKPLPINGLFCFVDVSNSATRIYNLGTRQVTPWAQTCIPLQRGPFVEQTPTYGFGFDPLTNNYKVLCVWEISGRSVFNREITRICEVLTVGGENQWRKIDEVPPVRLYGPPDGVYANGSIYWRNAGASFCTPPADELIVAFDVGTEKFRVIRIPDFVVGFSETLKKYGGLRAEKFSITQIDGHMALIDRVDQHIVKLWISDDDCYNEQKKTTNWTDETISLPCSFESGYDLSFSPVEGTDEIVVKSHNLPTSDRTPRESISLYIYNRTMKRFRVIDITGLSPLLNYPYGYDVRIVHESLLSIQQDSEKKKLDPPTE